MKLKPKREARHASGRHLEVTSGAGLEKTLPRARCMIFVPGFMLMGSTVRPSIGLTFRVAGPPKCPD